MTTTEFLINLVTLVFAASMSFAECGMAFDNPNHKRFHYFAAFGNLVVATVIMYTIIRN